MTQQSQNEVYFALCEMGGRADLKQLWEFFGVPLLDLIDDLMALVRRGNVWVDSSGSILMYTVTIPRVPPVGF